MNELNELFPKVMYKTLETFFFLITVQSAFSHPPLSIWMKMFYPFYVRITCHGFLMLEKVLLVIFSFRNNEFVCLEVHVVSMMALVTKSEIDSGGENQELKEQPNRVSKK